ncbi:hypothetical protein CWC02_03715 [Pseudoalteromonas sp. S2721]|uniref:hypothetical protein n=1 Tax=Pseudoalteromonas sp. S2721 TaxID=579526 RepID=UPI00110A5025|nr:hypothetical protein [Pseudoalteromonas sp. S2721]TMP20955.1 hypothetical protein CWC02_03715 [Pseudoalteromonas sp. S2721]
MRRSRKKMLEGQVPKLYSDRITIRVPEFILQYVEQSVQDSGISRNRWLSDAVIAFNDIITFAETPFPLTENQTNEYLYSLVKRTQLSFLKRDESLPIRFTENAEDAANKIAWRYKTQLDEGESLPQNIRGTLLLVILIEHMLRHNTQEKISSVA